jgi:hypothetical protein
VLRTVDTALAHICLFTPTAKFLVRRIHSLGHGVSCAALAWVWPSPTKLEPIAYRITQRARPERGRAKKSTGATAGGLRTSWRRAPPSIVCVKGGRKNEKKTYLFGNTHHLEHAQ